MALSSLPPKESGIEEVRQYASKLRCLYTQFIEILKASQNPPQSLVVSDSLCPSPNDRLNNANLTILPKRKPIGMKK